LHRTASAAVLTPIAGHPDAADLAAIMAAKANIVIVG